MCLFLSFQVLFNSWWSSSYHLWNHRSCQCEQLWRQQSLVSESRFTLKPFDSWLCVVLFGAEVNYFMSFAQSCPCSTLTFLPFLCLLQLLAGLALQSWVFLCPCWLSGAGDLDLFPVHCVSPEASCDQRMHRNQIVLSWDWGPSCIGRKHQPALHWLSRGTYNPSCASRGSVFSKDTILCSGSHPLPVCGSVVLWGHGSMANRPH